MYYVYILQSKLNKELYIGSTTDLKRRIIIHNSGKQISTKRYRPWEIIYYEAYKTESLARIREKRLKHHGNAIRELKLRIGLSRGIYPAPLLKKDGAGFTLIELLVAIAIIGIVLGIGLASLAATLRSSSKTTVFNQVNQSGELAMETMVRAIRNAVDVCTTPDFHQILIYPNRQNRTPSCSPLLPTGEIVRYRCDFSNPDGRIDRFDLSTGITTPITTAVNMNSCTFSHSDTVPKRVTIDFTLNQSTSLPQTAEYQVSIPFHSEVTLRNF